MSHFPNKDANITLDNVLSYESTSEKLKIIFQKYEEITGEKRAPEAIMEESDDDLSE